MTGVLAVDRTEVVEDSGKKDRRALIWFERGCRCTVLHQAFKTECAIFHEAWCNHPGETI